MAPSTRLRSKPALRVDYAPTRRVGTRGNPILLEESLEPETTARRQSESKSGRSKRSTRVKSGAVTKPTVQPKKVVKAAPEPKETKRPAKQECSICAETKSTARSFKVPEDGNACEHLETICIACIQKMLKTKVAERQLTEAALGCPFPNCEHGLDFAVLKTMMKKAAFEEYDKALMKYFLSANVSYIACLSEKCGKYFSIENCKSGKRDTQQIACPYCEYEICLTCNRPWESHGSGGCNKAKAAEDEESEKTVKSIGAKPCPECGVNIQKHGGCDHMTCRRCNHHFCWDCLVSYSGSVEHAAGCIHGRVHAAADPGNWVPQNFSLEQINRLIAGGPPAPPPVPGGHAPPPALVWPPQPNGPLLHRAAVPLHGWPAFPFGNFFAPGGANGHGGPPQAPR